MIEHIQINDVAPRIHYDADGVQSAFTYPFAIFKASDLEVWLGESRQNSGFTVSGAGISSGGTVLFAAPPPAATRVTLHRRLTLERVSDYQADGIIRAKTLNDELDYQVAALQQVAEDVGRALKQSPISGSVVELTLPEPVAGRGLKWNPSGSALVNSDHDPDTLGNVFQALADAQAAAQAAGTARDQTLAAAGSVKVSANDSVQGPLVTKLMAGSGITVTESGDGADERLVIASTVVVPQSVTDRLTFLERNLALTVLRDQI
ncbi:MAG: hypothetical protein H7Z12_16635, partial [Rhodospirillaceae bacterium]|nr:hypothetical protein [Rhodospirillales bacterium]